MRASKEYKNELKVHQDALRLEFPDCARLKEMITLEVERLGMTLDQFFQPATFGHTLHNKRSSLLEAIALVTEERMAMKKRQATTSRPSA